MSYMGALSTVATWIIIYIVVKIIVKRAGVGDEKMTALIKKIKKFQQKMHKFTGLIKKEKPDKKNGIKNYKRLSRYLRKNIINYRKVDRIFNVYLFDNSDDKNIANIRKEFANCEVILKDLIVEFVHNYDTDDKEKDLEDKQAQIDVLCDTVCQKIEKERLKQLDDKMRNI